MATDDRQRHRLSTGRPSRISLAVEGHTFDFSDHLYCDQIFRKAMRLFYF